MSFRFTFEPFHHSTYMILITVSALVDIKSRVGHRILSRSERSGLSRSFKERSVLSRSFFELLATYETQKNGTFITVLFKRTEKNGKERSFLTL